MVYIYIYFSNNQEEDERINKLLHSVFPKLCDVIINNQNNSAKLNSLYFSTHFLSIIIKGEHYSYVCICQLKRIISFKK
jgi:hypothetical protein